MKLSIIIGAVFSVIICGVQSLIAQDTPQDNSHPPLYENLGNFSRAITTSSQLAQAYFDQGLVLAYSFARSEAALSFRAARYHDPDCAMCLWGEAWALGPYLNNEGGVGDYQKAVASSRKALNLVKCTEPWEEDLIRALTARYPDTSAEKAATEAYAEAMAEVASKHEDDPEIAALYAESLVMYRPWNLHSDNNEPYTETRKAIDVLENILQKDLSHPGVCHLYIHAVEAWQPERAEACADLLADSVPGVEHIQHMPSHIYMHTGRYADAVRSNQKARMVKQAADYGKGIIVYRGHNTSMLVFAAWMDGQSGVALSAARDLGRMHPGMAFQYDLMLARFGRWDQLLENTIEPEREFQAALWNFAQGLAYLRTGSLVDAVSALHTIRNIREKIPEEATYTAFGHPQKDILGIAQYILKGEIAASKKRFEDAEAALHKAIALEDGLPYSEPEPWPIPSRHILGAILLEADRPQEAESIYRESLESHPNNGWSLKGLYLSLEAQGKTSESDDIQRAFNEAWQRADIWLPGSRI